MKTYIKSIDWRRFQESRELAGEWRLLKAKIRHVLDGSCRLAERVALDAESADAIETLRLCVLDYFDGRPFRAPPSEILRAVARVLEIEPDAAYARAA